MAASYGTPSPPPAKGNRFDPLVGATLPIWAEWARFGGELARLRRDPVFRGEGVPAGRGRPVMLVPGFLAGDRSVSLLTTWLRDAGYRTRRAGIGWNIDCSERGLIALERRLEAFAEARGERVTLIGQSRGGTFARAAAVRRPDLVAGVITLGSPLTRALALHPLVQLHVLAVGALGSLGVPGLFRHGCLNGPCCARFREDLRGAFPTDEVGFVSIYSRSDGIVDWRACLDPDAEHVEVSSSHLGMGVSPAVYRELGSALGRIGAAGDQALADAA